MESVLLNKILREIVQATENDGWFEAPVGKTISLYVNRTGASVVANKVNAVRVDGELILARTSRGETYVFYLVDLFAAIVEGTSEAKRKAGFA